MFKFSSTFLRPFCGSVITYVKRTNINSLKTPSVSTSTKFGADKVTDTIQRKKDMTQSYKTTDIYEATEIYLGSIVFQMNNFL